MLAALKTYAAGRGVRGKRHWTPVGAVVDALDAAFYAAFGNVEPAGQALAAGARRVRLDDGGAVAGVPGLTPRVASAAMALVTAATEPRHTIVGFHARSRRLDGGQ